MYQKQKSAKTYWYWRDLDTGAQAMDWQDNLGGRGAMLNSIGVNTKNAELSFLASMHAMVQRYISWWPPEKEHKTGNKIWNPRYQSRHLSRESTGEKVDQVLSHRLIRSAPYTDFGKGSAAKWVEFSEKFQTVFDPPPSFSENYVANFSRKKSGKKPFIKDQNLQHKFLD